MASTAKKMRRAADDAISEVESTLRDVGSEIDDATDEMAYQAEDMKRNPLAMTLLVLLGLGILGAIVMMFKDSPQDRG